MFEPNAEADEKLEKDKPLLEAARRFVQTVMTKSGEGILLVDERARLIRFANPAAAAIYCCRSEELPGRHFDYDISSDHREVQIEVAGGKTVLVEMWGEATEWDQEKVFVVFLRDITESRHREQEALQLQHRAEEEIQRWKTGLVEQTRQFRTVNQELEAFNHMVSRSLRRPITNINSYCQVIQELCGSQLDEQCTVYLAEIYRGSLHMSHLIDALLKFSRLTLAELHPETVDLSKMAEVIAAGLKAADPARRVAFRIAEGITTKGDPRLLWTAMENLLSNAWKYTSEREEGIIEFGMTEIRGKPAYFVRDNGAGFEKTEAEKLFLPFPNLPGTENFTGYGIGLATVERIVRHHGGMIWASGERGKGATFYFTLKG